MLFSPDERTSPPFAWFFLYASLEPAADVGVLLLYFVSGVDLVSGGTDSLFAWRGRELFSTASITAGRATSGPAPRPQFLPAG